MAATTKNTSNHGTKPKARRINPDDPIFRLERISPLVAQNAQPRSRVKPVEQALAAIEKAMDGVRAALQGQAQATAGGPAAPSGMLPVGTMVRDPSTSESGIIVGAFRGKSRVVYVFVGADGEVDCQYGDSLQTAEGNRGGLPAVTDVCGGDPLAGMRGTMPTVEPEKKSDCVRLVIGLDGKPITGPKLVRRVVRGKRRERVATAA